MATIQEMMSNIRLRLGDPLPEKPGPRPLLKAVLDHTQGLYNQLNNVSRGWSTKEVPLQVQAGSDDYLIAASDFGKPLLVFTQDSANPSHWERPVSFYEIQNLHLAYQGPKDGANAFASADGSNHTAAGLAFYRVEGNAVRARVRPVPQASAMYRIIYMTGDWSSNAALDSSPVLTEHHQLIEVRSALAVLPLSEWSDDDKANQEKRRNFGDVFRGEERLFRRDFEAYIRSVGGHRVSFRRGYGG